MIETEIRMCGHPMCENLAEFEIIPSTDEDDGTTDACAEHVDELAGSYHLPFIDSVVPEGTLELLGVTVTITKSDGMDNAVLILIDTEFEPDASDDGPGLRVLINDDPTYAGVEYIPKDDPS